MKAKVKRVKVVGPDRPNQKLRKRGAVRFEEIAPALQQADSPAFVALPGTTDRKSVKMDVVGSYLDRPIRKIRLSKLSRAIAKELDYHPSRDEEFNECVASGNTHILASL